MGKPLLADFGISISELKKNPSAAIRAADGAPVAILNRNTPEAYLVPADAWEAILDALPGSVRRGDRGLSSGMVREADRQEIHGARDRQTPDDEPRCETVRHEERVFTLLGSTLLGSCSISVCVFEVQG